MSFLYAICKSARTFRRREDGAATIEAVLWLPFFLGLFGLLADVSMVFYNQTRLLRIVQDANRNRAINRLADTDETAAFVVAQASRISPNVTATSLEPDTEPGVISTTASVPAQDLDMFGIVGVFSKMTLSVHAEHLKEDY